MKKLSELYAEILSDPDHGFAQSLERLALKKSSNNEVFRHIQSEFLKGLKNDSFKETNVLNFVNKNGDPIAHKDIETSIDKLRVKYKSLKQEWNRLNDRIKNGSGLATDKESRWFKHLNPVFVEANDEISLPSNAAETSFGRDVGQTESKDDQSNKSDSNENDANLEPSAKKKVVVAPHKKCKVIRSNKQALSEIAQSLKTYSEAQNKRHQKSIDKDKKREERFLQFKREEAEKDHMHEMRMAQMFITTMQNLQQSRQQSSLHSSQVPFYHQNMQRSNSLSPTENNYYQTPNQQSPSFNTYIGPDSPGYGQSFYSESQTKN